VLWCATKQVKQRRLILEWTKRANKTKIQEQAETALNLPHILLTGAP
jgi:hypothetical protein